MDTKTNLGRGSLRRGTRGPLAFGAVVLAAATLLAGCSVGKPDTTLSPTSTPPAQSANPAPPPPPADPPAVVDPGAAVDARQAAEVALAQHPDGKVVEIELEHSNGNAVWEVKVLSAVGGWTVLVDVVSGQVVGERDRSDRDHSAGFERISNVSVDYAQAIDVVEATVPDGEITELGLDTHRGTVIWEAEVVVGQAQKYEIKIDAATGEVLSNKPDH